MTSLSDSDSDLDFLAEIQNQGTSKMHAKSVRHNTTQGPEKPQPRTTPVGKSTKDNPSESELLKLKQQLWEKKGENEILRAQLNKIQASHQRSLSDVLAKQSRDKEEHLKELDNLRKEVERERIQHQFLLAELRLKNSGKPTTSSTNHQVTDASTHGSSTSSALVDSRSHPSSLETSRQSSARTRTASNALGDGFILKKPKVAPSNVSSTLVSPIGSLPDSETSSSSQSTLTSSDSSQLVTFLLNHRAPGFDDTSLRLLFDNKTAKNSDLYSIGQKLTSSLSLGDFVLAIVEYIEDHSKNLENEAVELLLSVLYDSLFLEIPFTSHKPAISQRLLDLVLFWVKALEPLPKLQALRETNTIRISHARQFVCILYALDVLLAADWIFEVPYELSRRVLSLTYAPQLCSRMLDLMAAHPSPKFSTFIDIRFPSVPAEPRTESLFNGLTGPTRLTAVGFARGKVPPPKFAKFVSMENKKDNLEEEASAYSKLDFTYMQTASVRLAKSLISCSTTPDIVDEHVLSLLTASVDSFILYPESPIVCDTIFYLWSRDQTSLKQSLSTAGIAELCVCLAKLVYGSDPASNTVEQARQLLQVLSSSEEIDKLLEVFEPLDNINEDEAYDLMIDS